MPSKSTTPHRRFFIRPAIRKSARRNRDSSELQPSNYSATMSSITPQSFVDDGGSFTKRIPRGLDQRHVAKWVSSNGSDTSAYTGSYVDDGADMHLPRGVAPGFGPIDTRFYKQKKRKEPKDGAGVLWNDDVQKAISGEMQRNLEKIRGLRVLEVKRTNHGSGPDDTAGGQEKAKDTVTIPMPPQWGTFVIKGDDGRVIVVDKDGEFDSGPQKAAVEQPLHWIKAASTAESGSSTRAPIPPSPPIHRTPSRQAQEHSKERSKQTRGSDKKDKQKKSRQSHRSPPKILTPITESEYEDGYLPSGGEDLGSPTGFMMTGGASGWSPSRATSVASPAVSVSKGYEYVVPDSPIKPISEGFRYVTPHPRGVIPQENSRTGEKKPSSGRWPSPEPSSVKDNSKTLSERSWNGDQFESAWKAASPSHSHKSDRSQYTGRCGSLPKSRKSSENASVRSFATYKAPTVEDGPNTSSEEKDEGIATRWRGSVKSSGTQNWGGNENTSEKSSNSKRDDKEPAWISPQNTPHPHTWAGGGSKSPSEQSWSKRPKAADNPSWTGIEPSAFQKQTNSPASVHFGSPIRSSSDATWDGFERNKSTSEVGVVDTGSERASLGRQSRVSSRQSTHRSHHSRDSRGSHKSNRHAQPTGWEDGQTGWAGGSQTSHHSRYSHRPDATAGWPGSRAVSEQSWGSRKARVDDGNGDGWGGPDGEKGEYANGFDEDNATYLNDNWGGVPVRVGSRAGSRSSRLSGAGWE